jgi:hypothetical protein
MLPPLVRQRRPLTSTIDELDCDALIVRLAWPLSPHRVAFRRAAEEAPAQVPCQGEGAIYGAVAALQRSFRNPPSDYRAAWDIAQDGRICMRYRKAGAVSGRHAVLGLPQLEANCEPLAVHCPGASRASRSICRESGSSA